MAFEPLAPPILPTGIRKPTAAEIAEVMTRANPERPEQLKQVAEELQQSVERFETWPAGSHCECKRNRKDGRRCGHIWKTRIAGKPTACPSCKQSRWDQEPHQRKRKSK